MQIRRLIPLVFAVLAWAWPMLGHAQASTYPSTQSDLYLSPQSSGVLAPSGAINLTNGASAATLTSVGMVSYTTTPAAAGDTTNLLGCGGVGQNEYTSALYNMPESFGKFQTDVGSDLAKKMLTMNYIMPQSAALFDQLNNYGNERYQSFQKGCQVSALKQDARNQYLNACVAEQVPLRLAIIEQQTQAGSGSGNQNQGTPITVDMKNAQAYAQAWEICSNGSISDTTALATRKKTLDAFAQQTRAVENVTAALKPLLCPQADATGGTDKGCWPSLLLPQVRLCLDSTLGCTGTGANGYGVNEPVLPMNQLFDSLRYIMDDTVVSKNVMPFYQMLKTKGATASIAKLAAGEATLNLSSESLARIGGTTTGTTSSSNATNTSPSPSVAGFQLGYLSCKEADILNPLKEYTTKINARLLVRNNGRSTGSTTADNPGKTADDNGSGNTGIAVTLTPLTPADFKAITDRAAASVSDDDKTSLSELAWVSLGCTANQTVPLLDPNLVYALNQCPSDDRNAFYTMAEYDVAQAATRDIYRYLSLTLKRIYTQLLTQPTVVSGTLAAGATASTSPTISPEINAKMATVVKEVMIPYVEGQIARLEELNRTRGEFALRVQNMYSSKSGCIFNANDNQAPAGHGPH